jgi:drug/metabolite transporter (DMT)-like permease
MPRLSLLTAVAVWGGTFVATKLCLNQLAPMDIVGFRFLIGLPVLAAIVFLTGTPRALSRSDLPALVLGSFLLLIQFVAQAYALGITTATNTAWLITASPLAIAVLGVLILKEQLGGRTLVGIVVATTGVILLVSKGHLASLGWLKSVGDWIALGTAINWAFYVITIKNVARRRGALLVTCLVYIPATLAGTIHIIGASAFSKLPILTAPVIWSLLFLAVPGMLAQWLWNLGLSRLDANKAGLYIYLEPVTTTLLAAPLLGESFGLAQAIGAGLIIGGVQWAGRK